MQSNASTSQDTARALCERIARHLLFLPFVRTETWTTESNAIIAAILEDRGPPPLRWTTADGITRRLDDVPLIADADPESVAPRSPVQVWVEEVFRLVVPLTHDGSRASCISSFLVLERTDVTTTSSLDLARTATLLEFPDSMQSEQQRLLGLAFLSRFVELLDGPIEQQPRFPLLAHRCDYNLKSLFSSFAVRTGELSWDRFSFVESRRRAPTLYFDERPLLAEINSLLQRTREDARWVIRFVYRLVELLQFRGQQSN